eukprot:4748540-Lingulodinium_polyedra.AAC.1
MHDDTCAAHVMPSKDKYPEALRSYLRRTHGLDGADVKGGTVYSDNERVLNSSRVDRVLDEYHMHATNSCEYEPWQNPAERFMRTLQEPMRIMKERGAPEGQGDEYWEFFLAQAALIHELTTHKWSGPDDGRTPHERKGRGKPSVAGLRPMLCLAYVRTPPALRGGKLTARAE